RNHGGTSSCWGARNVRGVAELERRPCMVEPPGVTTWRATCRDVGPVLPQLVCRQPCPGSVPTVGRAPTGVVAPPHRGRLAVPPGPSAPASGRRRPAVRDGAGGPRRPLRHRRGSGWLLPRAAGRGGRRSRGAAPAGGGEAPERRESLPDRGRRRRRHQRQTRGG